MTNTSDAEAIARIIDPNAFRGAFLSTQPSLSKDRARAKAAAILSYLASRHTSTDAEAIANGKRMIEAQTIVLEWSNKFGLNLNYEASEDLQKRFYVLLPVE